MQSLEAPSQTFTRGEVKFLWREVPASLRIRTCLHQTSPLILDSGHDLDPIRRQANNCLPAKHGHFGHPHRGVSIISLCSCDSRNRYDLDLSNDLPQQDIRARCSFPSCIRQQHQQRLSQDLLVGRNSDHYQNHFTLWTFSNSLTITHLYLQPPSAIGHLLPPLPGISINIEDISSVS